jgi:hypothetical protein
LAEWRRGAKIEPPELVLWSNSLGSRSFVFRGHRNFQNLNGVDLGRNPTPKGKNSTRQSLGHVIKRETIAKGWQSKITHSIHSSFIIHHSSTCQKNKFGSLAGPKRAAVKHRLFWYFLD